LYEDRDSSLPLAINIQLQRQVRFTKFTQHFYCLAFL